MATTIANFNHAFPIAAADTYNYTTAAAGTHTIAVKITDWVDTTAGISLTINNAGSTIATLAAGQAGGELNLNVQTYCATNTALQIIVSSTTAADTLPGHIRGTLTITRTAG